MNDGAPGQCGSRILLPASFTSSPRFQLASYQDAIAITARYGKPDMFITMTCNPKWKEIADNLAPGQTATDRPDIVARVFRMKFNELKKDILERGLFGRATAHVFIYEWQKRGLPHVHFLLTLHADDKPRTAANGESSIPFLSLFFSLVDRLISAELPEPGESIEEIVLFERVSTHMIHRDCSVGSPCWRNGSCSKRFPKPFRDDTDVDVDGYPAYKRRNSGIQARIGEGNNAKACLSSVQN